MNLHGCSYIACPKTSHSPSVRVYSPKCVDGIRLDITQVSPWTLQLQPTNSSQLGPSPSELLNRTKQSEEEWPLLGKLEAILGKKIEEMMCGWVGALIMMKKWITFRPWELRSELAIYRCDMTQSMTEFSDWGICIVRWPTGDVLLSTDNGIWCMEAEK